MGKANLFPAVTKIKLAGAGEFDQRLEAQDLIAVFGRPVFAASEAPEGDDGAREVPARIAPVHALQAKERIIHDIPKTNVGAEEILSVGEETGRGASRYEAVGCFVPEDAVDELSANKP